MNRGFLTANRQARYDVFPSIETLYDDNCVSLDNFVLYIKYVPTYKDFSDYFDSELKSAIYKINQGMPGKLQIWLTPNEEYVINEIIKIIQSQPQEYFGRKPGSGPSKQKLKTVCPILLDYLKRLNIIQGGKTRRRTTKQKRYSRKYKKITKHVRYRKRK